MQIYSIFRRLCVIGTLVLVPLPALGEREPDFDANGNRRPNVPWYWRGQKYPGSQYDPKNVGNPLPTRTAPPRSSYGEEERPAQQIYAKPQVQHRQEKTNFTTDKAKHTVPRQKKLTILTRGINLPLYKESTRTQVAVAGINYLINQQSNSSHLCIVQATQVQEHGIEEISQFVNADTGVPVRAEACFENKLFEVYKDYPYACNQDLRADPDGAFRLDWMAYKFLIQDNYHNADQVPRNRKEIQEEFGVDINFNNPNIARKVISNSFVSRDLRTIGVAKDYSGQPRAILTFDFNLENKKGVGSLFAANPINIAVEAGEMFYKKPNGLWKYQLLDLKNDKILNSAPAGVADFGEGIKAGTVGNDFVSVTSHSQFNSVRNGVDCLICHAGGINSISNDSINKQIIRETAELGFFETHPDKEDLVRQLYNVPRGRENDASYDDAKEVNALLAEEARQFSTVLKKLQVTFKDPTPLLPDISALYLQPVDMQTMANELEISHENLVNKMKAEPRLRRILGIPANLDLNKAKVDRILFEEQFCKLRSTFFRESLPQLASHTFPEIAETKTSENQFMVCTADCRYVHFPNKLGETMYKNGFSIILRSSAPYIAGMSTDPLKQILEKACSTACDPEQYKKYGGSVQNCSIEFDRGATHEHDTQPQGWPSLSAYVNAKLIEKNIPIQAKLSCVVQQKDITPEQLKDKPSYLYTWNYTDGYLAPSQAKLFFRTSNASYFPATQLQNISDQTMPDCLGSCFDKWVSCRTLLAGGLDLEKVKAAYDRCDKLKRACDNKCESDS